LKQARYFSGFLPCPEEFNENVYRKDTKSDHHGGIFVAIKTTFDSEEAEELKSTAEIIWAKTYFSSIIFKKASLGAIFILIGLVVASIYTRS
jgi:hypothetical protein